MLTDIFVRGQKFISGSFASEGRKSVIFIVVKKL